MDNKIMQNKTEKETPQNTPANDKTTAVTETSETPRPLSSKRRSRRRLPAW
jgi:hypothetical protein